MISTFTRAGAREHARSGFGGVGWALAGAAGVAALAVLGAQKLGPSGQRMRETEAAKGRSGEPEVEYSIPIERPADELHRAWRNPETLPRIMGFLADIRPSGDGRSEWSARGPLGDEMSISPDEQWVLFGKMEQAGSELMLFENFH